MVDLNAQKAAATHPIPSSELRKPVGACLVDAGVITQDQLDRALDLQARQNAPLGEILVSEGWASRKDVLAALSAQTNLQIADLVQTPPSAELSALKPMEFWLRHNVIPWLRIGPFLFVATARPDRFATVSAEMAGCDLTIVPVVAAADQIDRSIAQIFSDQLAENAEARVTEDQSCRTWTAWSRTRSASIVALALLAFVSFPLTGMAVLATAAVVSLLLFMIMRFSGLLAFAHQNLRPQPAPSSPVTALRQPCVSIMVPLYKEREIAGALIRRLQRLTYPKALLDVILVLEEKDDVTRDTLSKVDLPSWIRTIEVPELNGLTTKPRAMNYALDFCRGDILGVWDAEDAPQPDQIERVVDHFTQAAPEVVCLQGALDYYNPRTNWRSRCFTIEYNSWFRVILPGIAKLGFVVPLGGTTFFFRRDKLLELGGWDAHNVTEDADLGVRLCRAGYRTEIVNTTTFEEANFRAWPWVKQRSRWLKGFMVTYLVHMRAPLRLLRDLGPLKFIGIQAFFMGTVGQFLLAPVLWMFWLTTLGLNNPFLQVIPMQTFKTLIWLFLAAEALNFIIGVIAVWAKERRFLLPWVPTMILYFPLGVVAAYKALWELAAKPFFWDKTQHGQASEDLPLQDT
ncbi:glycosyltransferase [Ruegeria sp. R13_0]|uniref:glycosyltransferase n=1 Tax=Ruegeria sp. R13_0 TaxID=2821099 RepID=UPI001AD9DA53|nr:glycosyltransferase [Ruegeria sp. R13_0]MBO9432894.1 glycosyltransferase [Ruegeria sp. R13_0]